MNTTTAPSIQDIAGDWAGAWNGADQTRLAALFTADATYTDLAVGKAFEGHAAITGFTAGSDALIADLNIELMNAFGNEGQVAIESVYSGHFRGAPPHSRCGERRPSG